MQFRLHRLTLLAAAVAATSAVTTAQSFNIDCGTANGVPAATFSGATAQAGYWNARDCGVVGPTMLTTVTGTATIVGLTISGTNFNFTFQNTGTSGNDELLLDDLQDLSGPGATTWTIGPLAAATYTVTVYAWAPDVRTDNSTITVVGGANGAQVCGLSPGFSGYVLGQTHVQDTVIVSTGGSIVITGDGATAADYGSMNGIQITAGATPPTSFCTAGTSTNGCVPSISASANPSVSLASACTFTVSQVEGQRFGIIFYGVNNTGYVPPPWGVGSNSFLCVKPPTQRMDVNNTGGTANACDGSLVQDWNAFHTAHPGSYGTPFAVGSNAFVQGWYRDPPAPKTTNLSNAVQVTFIP